MPNDTLIVVHGGVPFEVTPFRGGDGSGVGGEAAAAAAAAAAEAEASTTAARAAAAAPAAPQERERQQALPRHPPPPSSPRPPRPALLRGYAAAALDARLRDFTVNALMCDPASGTVLDWVGGRSDLSRGFLRCCRSAPGGGGDSGGGSGGGGDGSERLREDPLRCLRAVRFAAGLGLAVASETAEAVKELAPLCCPEKGVAAERIWKELVKLSNYEPERPGAFAEGMRLARELEVLQVILPEALHEEEEGGGGGGGGARMAGTDAALRRLPSDSPAVLRVATALPDSLVFSDGASSALTLRFKLSKKETRLLETLSLLKALDELTTAAGDDDDDDGSGDGGGGGDGDGDGEKQREEQYSAQDSNKRQKTAAASKKRDTMAWVRFYAGEGSGSCVAAMAARVSGEAERRRYASAHSRRLERLSKGVERARNRAPVVTAKYVQAEHGLKPGKAMGKVLALAEEFAVEQGREGAAEVVALMKEKGLWP